VRSRLSLLTIAVCAVAVVACRHHQNVVAPAVAPTTHAAVQAPTPVHVESPANEFKSPTTNADDLGDAVHATELAEQKGWIRDAYFDFDSARLRQDARDNLNESATWLEKHPKFNVLVEGHCDERGTEQYNLALGEKRAWEAKEYLAVVGLDPAHIKTISYGKDRPFDPNHNEEAWAKNRRAHLVLTQ
jgi:peptidoglycan-associated lipoprotein